ncbi:MAG TPA: phenylalanine--tRNA ligase subunit beta [Deltaproteobacteria bacterium]|nr:phenylalanine--tRNA ligase subunit beta [Deltaproteobacteria bacterium]
MLFSYNWLKEFADPRMDVAELAERLTMTGFEVEGVEETEALSSKVVTAEILTVEPHPNADKLSLCRVATDKDEYTVVCGARNMKPGDKVALALAGARLPGGVKIKKSRIRGVQSEGMMCSEVELGIADTSEGIMILPDDTPLGEDVNTLLKLGDAVLDVAVLPNRPDCLSVRGLAREISAVTGAAFRDVEPALKETGAPVDELARIEVEAPQVCRRYAARVVEGLIVGPSPRWLSRRLEAMGVRSVNNVVDVTNYVLLELGQPLHAFDLDLVKDSTLVVRTAREGESIVTLDGVARALREGMLVIADASGPQAVAGVMGGRATEVTGSTTRVLIEAAWFDPRSVRRTSRELNLSTDSSYRFERGVDIEGVAQALDRAAALMADIAGGRVAAGRIDRRIGGFEPRRVRFRLERASRLLGLPLDADDVAAKLSSLGITLVDTGTPGVWTAEPPSYRCDITLEADLIEEVARLTGFDAVEATVPAAPIASTGGERTVHLKRHVKTLLVNSGFCEVMNYSFISQDAFAAACPAGKKGVVILNPISEDQVVMRTSLLASLMENLTLNLSRRNDEIKIFEFGPVFEDADDRVVEKWKVAGLMYGSRNPASWNNPAVPLDFYDVKGVVEKLMESLALDELMTVSASGSAGFFHPGRCAEVFLNGKFVGIFGEAHPEILKRYELRRAAYLFELDIESVARLYSPARSYRPIARFPGSSRDVAFIVDDSVPYGEIIDEINGLHIKLIEKIDLFDVYYGSEIPPGKRSLALRVVYRLADRTLTHAEVDEAHEKLTRRLVEKFGVELRV